MGHDAVRGIQYREQLKGWMENAESNSSSGSPNEDANLRNIPNPTIRHQRRTNRAAHRVRAPRPPTARDAPIQRAVMDTVVKDGCIYF
ncbi:hypothetical protein ANO14919_096530 [Xylariales sp. No.14919]|nr:hypothetical protein ANO14919_096530 [Xylariales sp. No.14919]